MSTIIKRHVTLVWFSLVLLTFVAWFTADTVTITDVDTKRWATVAILVLAYFKVRLVIQHFMEAKHAQLPLRVLMEIWPLATLILMLTLYLLPLFT